MTRIERVITHASGVQVTRLSRRQAWFTMSRALRRVSRLGPAVRTIFGLGAARGARSLFAHGVLSDARVLAVEPLRGSCGINTSDVTTGGHNYRGCSSPAPSAASSSAAAGAPATSVHEAS